MSLRIRDTKDFWSGVMFMTVGMAAVVLGRRYPFGSTAEMGPGFFPTILGSLLAGLGLIASARSLRPGKAEAHLDAWNWRPVLLVLGSVALFAVTLPLLGLIVASMLIVVVSRFAAPSFRWGEVLVFGLVLTVACALVFVAALKMPMQIWPAVLGG